MWHRLQPVIPASRTRTGFGHGSYAPRNGGRDSSEKNARNDAALDVAIARRGPHPHPRVTMVAKKCNHPEGREVSPARSRRGFSGFHDRGMNSHSSQTNLQLQLQLTG